MGNDELKNFMVFGQETANGARYWLGQPIGVFTASTAEAACQAAAQKKASVGNYFAVEGTPWGISLAEVEAKEYGVADGVDEEILGRIVDNALQRRLGR